MKIPHFKVLQKFVSFKDPAASLGKSSERKMAGFLCIDSQCYFVPLNSQIALEHAHRMSFTAQMRSDTALVLQSTVTINTELQERARIEQIRTELTKREIDVESLQRSRLQIQSEITCKEDAAPRSEEHSRLVGLIQMHAKWISELRRKNLDEITYEERRDVHEVVLESGLAMRLSSDFFQSSKSSSSSPPSDFLVIWTCLSNVPPPSIEIKSSPVTQVAARMLSSGRVLLVVLGDIFDRLHLGLR